jgi:hypothetical protein
MQRGGGWLDKTACGLPGDSGRATPPQAKCQSVKLSRNSFSPGLLRFEKFLKVFRLGVRHRIHDNQQTARVSGNTQAEGHAAVEI